MSAAAEQPTGDTEEPAQDNVTDSPEPEATDESESTKE